MVNQFRTLLLNLSQGQNEDYIPPDYVPIKLPSQLRKFYDFIYPLNSSRKYKLFVTQYYLKAIQASNYDDYVINFDPRITYDLNDTEFFFSSDTSNPIVTVNDITSVDYVLNIVGLYRNQISYSDFTDEILIEQADSNTVTISSVNNNWTSFTADLTFSGGVSNLVDIKPASLKFQIIAPSESLDSGLVISFKAKATYPFSFAEFYRILRSNVELWVPIFGYKPDLTDKDLERIWTDNENSVYSFSALLINYINKVNSLL